MFDLVAESELQWLRAGWKNGLPPQVEGLMVFAHPGSAPPCWDDFDPLAEDPVRSLFTVFPHESDGGSAPSPLQRAALCRCIEEVSGFDPAVSVVAYWGRPDLDSDLPDPPRQPWLLEGLSYWTGNAPLRDVLDAPWGDYLGFVEWPEFVWPRDKSWLMISGEDAHFTAIAGSEKLVKLLAADPSLEPGSNYKL